MFTLQTWYALSMSVLLIAIPYGPVPFALRKVREHRGFPERHHRVAVVTKQCLFLF